MDRISKHAGAVASQLSQTPSQNSSLTSTPETSSQIVEYSPEQNKAIGLALASCMAVQRTYGKQGGDLKAIAKVFIQVLSDYSPEQIVEAINVWLLNSPEFPTPYDIKQQLDGNDEPKREIYQRICTTMRQGQSLTKWEWDYIKRYERRDSEKERQEMQWAGAI